MTAAAPPSILGEPHVREVAIRVLLLSLLALLIAATIAIGGYSILLASRRSAPPTAAPVAIAPLPELATPRRLEPRLAVPVGAAAPAADPGAAAVPPLPGDVPLQPLAIEVTGLPDTQAETQPATLPDTAGVAVFAAATGALWRWLPLAGADGTPQRRVLRTTAPAGELLLHLAPHPAAARHGAFVRLRVEAGRDPQRTVAVAATVQAVTVHVAAAPRALAAALRLVRRDDPDWLPLHCGFEQPAAEPLHLLLGPGDYELHALAVPGQVQSIAVPGPAERTVTFDLPLVRADRP